MENTQTLDEKWSKACGCSLSDIYNYRAEWIGVDQRWCVKHSELIAKQYKKLLGKRPSAPIKNSPTH